MNELCVAYESARMNGVELASVHEIRMWEKDESSLHVRLKCNECTSSFIKIKVKIIFI